MIWIELLTRQHEVVSRFRVDGDEARIGRAYDNDVVLDDPFVAPHHLRLVRGNARELVAEDLGSANGLFDDSGARVERTALDGQRPIRIGRTLLRVRDASHPVAAERPQAAPTRNSRTAAIFAAIALGVFFLELWLNHTGEWRASTWLALLVLYASLIVAWATGWALISRVFSGAARFATQLAIALAGVLVLHLYDWLSEIAGYSFASRLATEYGYVGVWTIVGMTVFFHLAAVGSRHIAVKAGLVVAVVAAAVSVHTVFEAEAQKQLGQRAPMATLLPPQLRFRAPLDGDQFFGELAPIKTALDRAREEEPTGPGLFSDLFDE